MPLNTSVTRTQQIQLELIRLSSFNNFDGDLVADSLIEHRNLWRAFLLDREAYSADYHRRRFEELSPMDREGKLPISPIDTIRLRDLEGGYWNVDVIFILPASAKKEAGLVKLAKSWHADEVDWYNGLDAGPKMLRVWWD